MPRRFNFGLQRVLDYRKLIEEQKKQEFIKAQNETLLQLKKVSDLVKHENEQRDRLAGSKIGDLNPVDLRLAESFLITLMKTIKHEREILEQLYRNLDEKRSEFIEAQKKTKVLERLKEKKIKLWQYEVDLDEQKFLDEVGRNSFISKSEKNYD